MSWDLGSMFNTPGRQQLDHPYYGKCLILSVILIIEMPDTFLLTVVLDMHMR